VSAVQLPLADRRLTVDGTEIGWGVAGSGEHTMVLVHGHQAHHGWWHAVIDRLADRWRFVVLDLSGHGSSGHRDGYSARDWTREIHAVARADGAERPLLVGHSMGGRVALVSGAPAPELFRGVVMLDSVLRLRASDGTEPVFPWIADRSARLHPEREQLLSRFRLRPEQPPVPGPLIDAVADYSMERVPDGWRWRHDQRGIPGVPDAEVVPLLRSSRVALHYVKAGASEVTSWSQLNALAEDPPPGGVTLWEVPEAHHHLVLDAPDATARVLDAIGRRTFRVPLEAGA